MTLAPLIDAAPAIRVHAFGAMPALGVGTGVLLGPKGTVPHRIMGWPAGDDAPPAKG
ncbi:MAG: hypothetical protein PHS60_03135 [Zavarzinia sp.]|nr:hypothetical protein [Zavarzinia sp.]